MEDGFFEYVLVGRGSVAVSVIGAWGLRLWIGEEWRYAEDHTFNLGNSFM